MKLNLLPQSLMNYILPVLLIIVVGRVEFLKGFPNISDYENLYGKLMELKTDPNKYAYVKNISFQRDVAKFDLHEGQIFLLSPIQNRVIGALFLGKGVFYASPPTEIEKKQLYRFYETDQLEKEFNMLFLIFADSTLEELEKHLTFTTGKMNEDGNDHVKYCLKFLSDRNGKYFDSNILKFILNDERNNYFYAHFSEKRNKPLCFKFNPYDVEEISLMHRVSYFDNDENFETICQFHKQADYFSGKNLANEKKDQIKIIHYKIESTIEENLDFSAITEVEFTALKSGQKWINFNMFSDMVVDSAFWENEKNVNFFKYKNNSTLWIRCDSILEEHCIRKLKLFYHGDILERDEMGWIYIKNSIGWYPRSAMRLPATFELNFQTPNDLTFVSVGKRMHSEVGDKMITTRWITPKPIRNVSFNLGKYKSFELKDERIPPVTICMSEYGHQDITHVLGKRGVLSGKDMEKQVGADVANSLAFFEHVFGSSQVEHFYATETPYLHGEAFPGLIHLAWTTFQRTGSEGYDEIFRAHEVAHQWWGIGVDFKTYHDQWLSEGFAEYAGLWYMQTVLKDNEKFFDVLKDYRKAILGNRKDIFGSGQEAGPIWLGYRTSSSETKGDYDLIIYKKGAWVLHMLRNMMLDLKTMNEDAFTNMIRDFYKTYEGKKASTEDFQKVVEKHVGGDMDWYFKQWVYRTDTPIYRYSYQTDKQPDGKFLVRFRVKQEEVPDYFKMYMTIKVEFENNREVYLRVFLDGPETAFALPLLPLELKKIEFNALESVLCEVKKEEWDN